MFTNIFHFLNFISYFYHLIFFFFFFFYFFYFFYFFFFLFLGSLFDNQLFELVLSDSLHLVLGQHRVDVSNIVVDILFTVKLFSNSSLFDFLSILFVVTFITTDVFPIACIIVINCIYICFLIVVDQLAKVEFDQLMEIQKCFPIIWIQLQTRLEQTNQLIRILRRKYRNIFI